ncbi:MAG: pyruvate, water dikinase regulatory protein [Coriobacteriales bacterium]
MYQVAQLHIVSDSLGDTAAGVVSAALSQFPQFDDVPVGRLTKVRSIDEIVAYLDVELAEGIPLVVFHTLVDSSLRAGFQDYAREHGITEVDLIGPSIEALTSVLGVVPIDEPGALHEIDESYRRRMEAMEYAVNHDDGRGEYDLSEADIVLIGVSRTSKTPLSLVLASRGYKVANIPLAVGVEPPASLFSIDSRRIFGLVSSAPLLSEIRSRRLKGAAFVAGEYADPAYIQEDLDEARAVMRRLGCIVIHTENKAVEETAQEILRYYNAKKA